jgi:predicted nucleotide-binding protein
MIEVRDGKKSRMEFDLNISDLDEIKNDIVLPYLSGDVFYFKGYHLCRSDVSKFIIKESDSHMSVLCEDYNKEFGVEGFVDYSQGDVFFKGYSLNDITRCIFKEVKGDMHDSGLSVGGDVTLLTDAKINFERRVFIVHGHDDFAKTEVARFVERIGYEAIILHEQVNAGTTIIEKIERYSDVEFGIVLYTPCDFGVSLKDKDHPNSRARQNVVFEHGFLIGKIGRSNVCALVKGDVEKPNDISGVVYVDLDADGAWKYKLAKEMNNSGCDVDLNKI